MSVLIATQSEVASDVSLFFPLAGGAFLLIAAGLWWWRPRLVISEQGASFLPLVLLRRYRFSWSDVERWRWHRYSWAHEDGEVHDTELILVFAGGREMVLPYPYCCRELAGELERRIGEESRQVP